MAKDGFLTPKAIANRIKAKGLQKLRWYCQMCEKQCRDANGFKCHCESDSHQRMMAVFLSSSDKFLDQFSQDFEKSFLELLKRRFGAQRVSANQVYNEYIADRQHVHMNSTVWETLTEYVKHLGRDGLCVVDETPKGWFIQYIDRAPETLMRKEAEAKKEKMDVDDEERNQRLLEQKILEAHQNMLEQAEEELANPSAPTELLRENEDEKIVFSLQMKGEKKEEDSENSNNAEISIKEDESTPNSDTKPPSTTPYTSTTSSSSSSAPKTFFSKIAVSSVAKTEKPTDSQTDSKKRKMSALEEIKEQQEKAREKANRKDYWLYEGIVVKIMNKKLGEGKYYKEKGVVVEVIDKYVGKIKVIETGDLLKQDQSQLETVIPSLGGKVKIVNGAYRGENATLQSLDIDNFSAQVKILSGRNNGTVISSIAYEDICKIA
eukprot:TRINITY_DN6015_c0_g3_i1.p1 TRINITY_DN6015_c0_g3~~TRINITY_DN6015_c0_g3_i1.p1  ORF type:complete len:434 (-),score=110.39 TRINITY_DN6015_c0_g3_i1:41-1342(-)